MVHDGLGSGCPPRANAIQWRLMPMHPIGDRVLIARATAVGGSKTGWADADRLVAVRGCSFNQVGRFAHKESIPAVHVYAAIEF